MTEHETRQLIALLVAAYPSASVSQETVGVYCAMLADLDAGAAQDAVKQLLSESRFFPSIAEIRQAAAERTLGLAQPAEAWGEVQRAIRSVGIYGTPRWSSAAVEQAVRAIGWDNICLCELDALNTLRAQFQRLYETYRARAVQGENLAGLGLEPGYRQPDAPRLPSGGSHWEPAQPRPVGAIGPQVQRDQARATGPNLRERGR